MDHGTKYWFAQTYEKQCRDIHFEFYSLFNFCHKMDEHNVKTQMNRCIKYTQFSIDDPKNMDKVDELKKMLELEKEFKEHPDNMDIAKKIDDFFSTPNSRRVFKKTMGNDNSIISAFEKLVEMIEASIPQTRMTIVQYDYKDDPIGQHTGTFNEVFGSIDNPSDFYYRIARFGQKVPRGRVYDEWFGVRTSCLGGLNFSIEETLNRYLNYMVKRFEKGERWNFFFILNHLQWYVGAVENLKKLKPEQLQSQLDLLQEKYPDIEEVFDLNKFRKKSGIYVMVLDKYNACYIGQSENITQRIMQHWSRSDYFSGVGIDLFKAYDTTRIFVLPCDIKEMDKLEHKLVELIDSAVTINILAGGGIGYLLDNNMPLLKNGERETAEGVIDSVVSENQSAAKLEELFIL